MKELSSQELRIGNYVEYGGVINKVYLLSHLYFQVESTDIPTFTANKNRAAQPIPLTEEWLFKFGFKKVKSDYEEAETWDFYFGILYFDMANNSVKINGQYCLFNIPEHVHQLQNLYFALTGEELTLEP